MNQAKWARHALAALPSVMNSLPIAFAALTALACLLPGPARAKPPERPLEIASPGFQNLVALYCFECHDNLNAEAEVNLEALLDEPHSLFAQPGLMQNLLWLIEDGEMPPVDAEQPSAPERAAMIAALRKDLDHLADLHQGDPGRVIMPRLTRDEYENVIRDLSGGVVELDAARFLAAPTRAGEGFTNVGEAHGSTLTDIEGYLDISRHVLQHLRIGPVSGLRWSSVPVESPQEAEAARKRLVLDVLDWHTLLQDRLVGVSHEQAIQDALGVQNPHSAYLEAAWRYRFREALGSPDASLDDIAANFEPPLHAESLRRWWKILDRDDAGETAPLLAHTVEGWHAIPGPDDGGKGLVRARCDALLLRQGLATSDFTLNEGPRYETTIWEENDKLHRQTMRYAEKEGWIPFDLELGDARRLYFILTDAFDGGEEDIALWHRGVFHRDGKLIPWETLPPLEIIDPESGERLKRVAWGKDAAGQPVEGGDAWTGPEDSAVDPAASVSLQAPVIARLAVPEGAERFTAELRIHRELGKGSSLQALILRETGTIEGDWAIHPGKPVPEITPDSPPTLFRPWMARFYPWRHIMGVPGSPKTKQANRDYHHARLLFKSSKLRLGRNAEKAIFAPYEGDGLEAFGGPWDRQRAPRGNPGRPYDFSMDEIREHASPDERAALEGLYGDVPFLAQPAYRELHDLVQQNRVKRERPAALRATLRPDSRFRSRPGLASDPHDRGLRQPRLAPSGLGGRASRIAGRLSQSARGRCDI